MESKNIDRLNLFLIIFSLIIAYKIPFELFLFSYAFLGPLHYLTEINWLKERNYFIKTKEWIWTFILFGLIISVPFLMTLPLFKFIYEIKVVKDFLMTLNASSNVILLASLFFSIGLVFLKELKLTIVFLISSILLSYLILKYVTFSLVLVSVFLPTVIHVYLFTWLFMLFGAMKSRSTPGYIGVVLLAIVPIVIAYGNVHPDQYVLSQGTKDNYLSSGFYALNSSLAKSLVGIQNESFSLLSLIGIKIQIFIAFAYTYHYLNWFSKTSIIGWHKGSSKMRLGIIATLWIASIGFYLYDYHTGIIVLFFLSFLHVFLEFPLNVVSIKGISEGLFKK
ncbi:MAG: hypothetical protein ACKOX3_02280 [Bacteroidota bacterium]